jgi:hypothetical protein
MLNWSDYLIQQEHLKDLLREAGDDRFIKKA